MDIRHLYDKNLSRVAQNWFTVNNKISRLVTYNGACPQCKRNVYDVYFWIIRGNSKQEVRPEISETVTGHTIRKATEELIVDCPHCHYKFK